jgi:hypothetical protein
MPLKAVEDTESPQSYPAKLRERTALSKPSGGLAIALVAKMEQNVDIAMG